MTAPGRDIVRGHFFPIFMKELPCILALDCGATSVRAMVVDSQGKIIGRSRQSNNTRPGTEKPDFHVWDADRILEQLCECSREVLKEFDVTRIQSVTVTTFGVDGALIDKEGKLLYPVISWKCPRTAAIMENIGKYMTQAELNRISGIGEFAFNTLYKLVWLKENRPELFDQAQAWLFISSLFNYRLTGVMTTDRTMAGTSQLTDLNTGDFSPEILQAAGLSRELFPRLVAAGDVVGGITEEASQMLGLNGHCPVVVSAGHDTQFAIFGSGAEENQPVLSSGTWEILMVRTPRANLAPEDYADGATVEYDACNNLVNPGLQWLGSGIIEWVKSLLYPTDSYDVMDAEAAEVSPGCDGVSVTPDFLPSSLTGGSINGLVLGRTRAHIYRAAMEGLSKRLKSRLGRLESISGFKSKSLILVGGGSRNRVWNQMRANILNIPVTVTHEAEITVLGAAMFAFAGAGVYSSPEEARRAFGLSYETFSPDGQQAVYSQLLNN